MIIKHNISSLNTNNKLKINREKTAKNLEKLSSGFKINRAGDDAAGLAISEKMRGQIRGLDMAGKNIQDGISLIQTAEGGLGNIQNPNLIRLRELAIQAANDTLTDADRQLLQKEVVQIKQGINDIANNTEFNGIGLLNETATILTETETITTTNIINETVNILSPGMILHTKFLHNPTGGGVIGLSPLSSNASGDGRIVFSFSNPPLNPEHIYVPTGADIKETLNNIKDTFESIKSGTSGTVAQQNFIASSNMRFQIYGDNFVLIADKNLSTTYGGGLSGGGSSYLVGTTASINYEKEVTETTTLTHTKVIHKNMNLQTGANSGNSVSIELTNATTTALGIDSIDLSTREGAESAISKIDEAISKVSSDRSKFGAYQNRLEHIYNSVMNTSENLQSAESRIRDTDMAKEMMAYTKNNILTQAAQAMLAHSNQQPESVLQLLQ